MGLDQGPQDSLSDESQPQVDDSACEGITRRELLRYGALGLGAAAIAGGGFLYVRSVSEAVAAAAVFKNDAPQGELWDLWQKRGWVREARHYLKLGPNVQCKVCPNDCLLEPEDRGRCRNKVNKDGTLYTLAYANPCALHVDPIEKKPLFHFLPGTGVYSIASSGCGFRCLNCQNWDISQRKPEETKDPRGEPFRLASDARLLRPADLERLTLPPDEVVAMARNLQCHSIAFTYSEPTSYYEYMIDTARSARQSGIKTVWVTCGYIEEQPLVELCRYLDAASLDLKSFSDDMYRKLNSGKLDPILRTLRVLKQQGVWLEMSNLVVPTYTDDLAMIRRMCGWMVETLGPDYPLHFLRFHPAHKLTHLPATPVDTLVEARRIAREKGLRYVYLGNVREVDNAETTECPGCRQAVVRRDGFEVEMLNLERGRCTRCGTRIAGVW